MIGFFRTNTENFEKCYEIEDFFSNYDINEVFINMEEVDYNSISTILPSDEEICCAITLYATITNSKFMDFHQMLIGMERNEQDTQDLLTSPLKQAKARENGFREKEIGELTWRMFMMLPGFIRRHTYKKFGLSEEIIHDSAKKFSFSKAKDYPSDSNFYHFMMKCIIFMGKIMSKSYNILYRNKPLELEHSVRNFRFCKSFTEHNIKLYNDFILFLNESSIVEYCYAYQARMYTKHNAEHEYIKEIIYNFMYYSMCYDKKWKDVLWGDFLTKASKVKGFNLEFIKKLNEFAKNDKNGYVKIFCDTFHEYDPDAKVLDTIRIKCEDKIYVRDTDNTHKTWYIEGTRLDKFDVRKLYQGLEKIWESLAKAGGIDADKSNKEIFIYRLSGINCPLDEENKDIKLNFKGNETLLGAIVRCLFEDKNKQCTPPYSRIAGFFENIKNLATIGNKDAKNPSMARAINIVIESGLSTIEDIKDRLKL